jgi:hypothetical protein
MRLPCVWHRQTSPDYSVLPFNLFRWNKPYSNLENEKFRNFTIRCNFAYGSTATAAAAKMVRSQGSSRRTRSGNSWPPAPTSAEPGSAVTCLLEDSVRGPRKPICDHANFCRCASHGDVLAVTSVLACEEKEDGKETDDDQTPQTAPKWVPVKKAGPQAPRRQPAS